LLRSVVGLCIGFIIFRLIFIHAKTTVIATVVAISGIERAFKWLCITGIKTL
jgi:hypothetical protein